MLYTLYRVHYTVHIVQSLLHCTHCTEYTTLYTLYTVLYNAHIVHCTYTWPFLHSALQNRAALLLGHLISNYLLIVCTSTFSYTKYFFVSPWPSFRAFALQLATLLYSFGGHFVCMYVLYSIPLAFVHLPSILHSSLDFVLWLSF